MRALRRQITLLAVRINSRHQRQVTKGSSTHNVNIYTSNRLRTLLLLLLLLPPHTSDAATTDTSWATAGWATAGWASTASAVGDREATRRPRCWLLLQLSNSLQLPRMFHSNSKLVVEGQPSASSARYQPATF